MLGVREDYVKNLVYRGELKRWEGNRKPFYYRIEDVEALARERSEYGAWSGGSPHWGCDARWRNCWKEK